MNTQQDSVAVLLDAAMTAYREASGLTVGGAQYLAHQRGIAAALQSQQVASADRGDAVCFRFQLQTGEWSRWLSMEDLVHYGPDGNLVDGPHPDWKQVEYAYRPAATPPSPAESAEGDGDCPFYSGGECTCGNDQHPYFRFAAAPSGVSDAVQELRRRIEAAWHNHDESGRVVITMRDAMMLVEEVLPQPGRVEGMDRG